MTRKHFVAFAATIRGVREQATTDEQRKLIDALIDGLIPELRAANSNFNADRFREAAGYGVQA